MKKLLLGFVGMALLGACSQVVGGFSAFNLSTPKEPCITNTQSSAKELNLSFSYTGTLKSIKLTFTPNGKTPVVANIVDLENPPAGFRINTLTANQAKLYIDLGSLNPTSAQAIPQPDVKQIFPMDVRVEASGANGERPGALELTNIDVAKCY